MIIAKRPRNDAQQLGQRKHQTNTTRGLDPWPVSCECASCPAGVELIPEPFSCKSKPRPQRLRLNAPQQIIDSLCCVPFTATFSKRRQIGALCNEHCDAWQCGKPFLHNHLINSFFLRPASETAAPRYRICRIPGNRRIH